MIRTILFLVLSLFVSFFSYSQKDLKLDAEFLENEHVWKMTRNMQGYWCWGGADSTKIWLIDESDQIIDYSDTFRQLTSKKFTDLLIMNEAVYVGTDGDYVLKYAGGVLSKLQNGIGSGKIEKLSYSDQIELCVRTPSETYISTDFVNFRTSSLTRFALISDIYSARVFLWDSTNAVLCGKAGTINNLRGESYWWDKKWEKSLVLGAAGKINSVFIDPYSSLDTINIYAGMNSGLYLLQKDCDVERFLIDTAVHYISRIRLDEVVACTSEGLILINVKDGIRTNKTYLKDMEVYSIVHDGGNFFWIGTSQGVKRYQVYQYATSYHKEYACTAKPTEVWAPQYKYPQYQVWLKDDVMIPDSISRTLIIDTPGTYKAISYYGPASIIKDTTVFEVSPYSMNDIKLIYPPNKKFCKDTKYQISVETTNCIGCTVKWQRDGVLLDNQNLYLLTTLPGDYSVEVANCNGVKKFAEVKMEVFVQDSVYIIRPSSEIRCAKEVVTLKSSMTSGFMWWYWGEKPLSSNAEIEAKLPGTYILMLYDGCTTKYDTAEVLFHDLPFAYLELEDDKIVAKNELFEDGKQVFFSEVTTYQWYYNEKKLPGENKSFLKPTKLGTYKVELHNSFGCSNFSQSYNYNVTGDFDPFLTDEIDVYPNPSQGVFNISIPMGLKRTGEFEVYNSKGSIIKKGKVKPSFEILLVESGIYFLCVKVGNEVFTKKLINLK